MESLSGGKNENNPLQAGHEPIQRTMNVRFLAPAVQELEDAFEWYENQMPKLGYEFLDGIDEAIHRTITWPESNRNIGDNLHRCLVRRFPYCLIYGMEEQALVIIAVAHLHRKPFYWTNRTS